MAEGAEGGGGGGEVVHRETLEFDADTSHADRAFAEQTAKLNAFQRLAQGIAKTAIRMPVSVVDTATAPLRRLRDVALAAFRDPQRELEHFTQSMSTFGFATIGLDRAFGALQGVFAGTGIGEFGDQVRTLRRETGMTADEVSGLIRVFERYDITAQDASTSLGIFARGMHGVEDAGEKQLDSGKGVIQTLKDLGVSVQDVHGGTRGMSEILSQVADQFQKMPDGIDKTAIAMGLFGRAGKDMIPVLDLGSSGIGELVDKASEMGLTLSDVEVDTIHAFKMSMLDFRETIDSVGTRLGAVLMPALNRLLQTFVGFGEWVAKNVRPLFESLGPVFDDIATGWEAVISAFKVDKGALGIVGDLIQKYFGEGAANTIRPFLETGFKVVDVIQGIVNGASDLFSGKITVGTFFRQIANGAGVIFNDLLSRAREVAPRLLALVVENIPKLASLGQSFVMSIADNLGISGPVGRAFEWLRAVALPRVGDAITRAFRWLTGPAWTTVRTAITGAFNWITGPAWTTIQRVAGDVLGTVAGFFDDTIKPAANRVIGWLSGPVWDTISTAAGTGLAFLEGPVWDTISGAASGALAWIEGPAWTTIRGAAGDVLGWLTGPVWNTISSAGSQAITAIKDVWPSVSDAAFRAFDWISHQGWGMIETKIRETRLELRRFTSGFQTEMNKLTVGDKLRTAWTDLTDAWNHALNILGRHGGKSGDNTVLGAVAAFVGSGFAKEIDNWALTVRVVAGALKLLLDRLDALDQWIQSHKFVSDFLSNVTGARTIEGVSNIVTAAQAASTAVATNRNVPTTTTTPGGEPLGGGAGTDTGLPIPHAAGGPVTAGRSYWVGEEGPERFIPAVSGMILPHRGAPTIQVALSVTALDLQNPARLVQLLAEPTAREIYRQLNLIEPSRSRGGALGGASG